MDKDAAVVSLGVLAGIGLLIFWLRVRRGAEVSDNPKASLTDLLVELEAIITSKPGRTEHLLPDLVLKMFAIQVLQYSRAVQRLSALELNSWAFPTARAAFEAAVDISYLSWAKSADEYDKLGSLAIVGAEMAVSETHQRARHASARLREDPAKQPMPETERVRIIKDRWESARPGASRFVQSAYDKATAARDNGRKHWTTIGRERVHAELRKRLNDPHLNAVLDSWYDILSARSHAGAHSPDMTWDKGEVTFLVDGDQDNPIPLATAEASAHLAINALRNQYDRWDSDELE